MKKIIKIILCSITLVVVVNYVLFFSFSGTDGASETVEKDQELGWDFSNYKPANYNDVGIRTSASSEEIKKSKKDNVLFLGNSVVAGNRYDYKITFSHLLNETSLGQKNLFLNGGQDGYEIYREFKKFNRDFYNLNVKYVVWVPSTNDYQDWSSIKRNFVETQEVHGLGKEKLNIKSELTKGFNKLASKIQAYKEINTEVKIWSTKNDFYTNPLKNKLDIEIKKTLVTEILEFKRTLDKSGVGFIVLLLPPRNFCLFNSWSDASSFQELEDFFKNEKIKSINLFDKIPCRDKNLYLDYVHFNEMGHVEVAKSIELELARIIKNEKNI